MPKCKSSCSIRLKSFVDEFGNDVFSTDGTVLYCKVCEIKVGSERRFTVEQHLKTAKHIRTADRQKQTQSQQLISNVVGKKSSFYMDMCRAFLGANIPFHKVNNKIFRNFLTKYTGKEIPEESTLRKHYLTDCYEETIKKIRNDVVGKKIFVSIDETTDCEGRYVANVIIGILDKNTPGKLYLLNSEELDKANYFTISKVFDQSMFLLWSEGIRHDDVLLFVTDAAPYMIKAANSLKALYSKMVHVTCLAHAHHRVAETIRGKFNNVDGLVSNVKKVFLKAPSRLEIFKTEASGIPLPPVPIITRWGTWLEAAFYYSDNFTTIQNVFSKLNPDDAVSIEKSISIMAEPNLGPNLTFIQSNFRCLPVNITKLESSGLTLFESINVVNNTRETLKMANGKVGKEIYDKFQNVIEKNAGFKTLVQISKIHSGEVDTMEGIEQDLKVEDLAFFKYAPITSVDVERSFSRYKNLLSVNRRSYKFDQIKKTIVSQCNADNLIM